MTESVSDTPHRHTHRGKFIFCPCIALDRQLNDVGRYKLNRATSDMMPILSK